MKSPGFSQSPDFLQSTSRFLAVRDWQVCMSYSKIKQEDYIRLIISFTLALYLILLSLSILVRKPTYYMDPIYAQVRQVGESISFTLTAKTVIPIVTWDRHTAVDGKDISYNISADHNITRIETRSPDLKLISTLNLYNLKLEDGGYYQATGRFKKSIHTALFTVNVFGE